MLESSRHDNENTARQERSQFQDGFVCAIVISAIEEAKIGFDIPRMGRDGQSRRQPVDVILLIDKERIFRNAELGF